MLSQAKPIAVVRNYKDLISVLRARAEELNISGDTLESDAGLTTRYSSKLLRATPVRTLGQSSLGAILRTLKLELAIYAACSAEEAFNAIPADIRKRRNLSQVRHPKQVAATMLSTHGRRRE